MHITMGLSGILKEKGCIMRTHYTNLIKGKADLRGLQGK